MNKQQILNHLISVSLFGNFEVGRTFNTAVVKLALENENTFDIDLLLRMVTASGFFPNLEGQREALDFVVDNILSKKNGMVEKNYTPEFPADTKEWAIDKCGDAYYYELITDRTSVTWHGENMIFDTKFDRDEFYHMWNNGAWKKSKITK